MRKLIWILIQKIFWRELYYSDSKSWYQGLRYALDEPEDAKVCRPDGDKYLTQ